MRARKRMLGTKSRMKRTRNRVRKRMERKMKRRIIRSKYTFRPETSTKMISEAKTEALL